MTTAEHKNPMAEGGMNTNGRLWNRLRLVGWSLAVLILLLPAVAMLFTDEVNWSTGDFIFAAIILGGIGLLFELAMRQSRDDAYRTGALLALASTFLLIWSNAAVGFVGSGSNAANVLYFAMLAVPVVGGSVTRFKARGMFLTMILTAITQASITVFAFAADLVGAEERIPILAINAIFILLWTGSALLYQQAAVRDASPVAESLDSTGSMAVSRIHMVLSVLMIAIGAVLLFLMITVEGEPGAIPLGMILAGMGWFAITLFRSRTSHNK